ncbi:MAG: Ribosomal RNA large subunit methyltransferase L [Nitrospirae bacterium]|nr:Ribosomal RNA large subunit methyltransferase L [Nitrospirota bacterium]MCK6493287.1 class I SAM-dependent RNA methyltransferase [Nitrospira sp.]QLH27953.1 MAG: class I SAM-dependent RNA methyltransferase [Candidatus Parvibacillus calidus]QOJ33857.1 MAG: class I SAM-dependent RNA methyltransferase [Nitrospira sp.]
MDSTNYDLFTPCPRGLETVLAEELTELDASAIHATTGGVHFQGTAALCYRVNLHSRIASRVLLRLSETPYRCEQDIYDAALAVRWDDWFPPQSTIKVKVSAQHCPLRSLDFVTLRVKDAVCDRFQRACGTRPSVDTHAPDHLIAAFLDRDTCSLYLDTSGDPLFKRGWRRSTGEAPIRENLAAGILRLARWTPEMPLYDPMCGSGTFVIEAALMARRIAPGIDRRFACERIRRFDPQQFQEMREAAKVGERPASIGLLHAADRSEQALASIRTNLAMAGCGDVVTLRCGDVLDLLPPADSGLLLTNPPYGHRMGDQETLHRFYPQFGDHLKRHFAGWTVQIFTADLKLPGLLRLAPSRRVPLFNGAIECRLFEFRMVAGSHRKPRPHDRQPSTP